MPSTIFNRFKGIVNCAIEDTVNNLMLVVAVPATATYDTGTELTEVESNNCAGTRIAARRFTSVEKPTFQLSFGTQSPDLLGLKFGKRFGLVNKVIRFSKTLLVPADGLVSAVTSGTLGFGLAANATTKASYLDDAEKSIALVQNADFAAFNAATTPLEFAIGANNAQKYGQGLWGKYVTYDLPLTLNNVYALSSSLISTVGVRLGVIDLDGKYVIWEFTGTPDTTGTIPIGEGTQDLNFFLSDTPQITYTNQFYPC